MNRVCTSFIVGRVRIVLLSTIVICGLIGSLDTAVYGQGGVIDFQIVDSESKEQIPARIHLWNSKGVAVRAFGMPFFP